ncbi:hypothetical protein BV898_18310 [Hypsibius exemplaris]|uniref:Uncharacterized protein n=1 Tax=Hypsibius exemplaris TaxID=2072580 RepID=A0A9X6NNX7_HYPEX|nr:hypothetical protein BV898_18310 [Hypsibius exemplaris]
MKSDFSSGHNTVALCLSATSCQLHNCQACGKEVRENGHHGPSCADDINRHSAINEVVKRALVSAGVSAIQESPGVCRADGITMTPFRHGRRFCGTQQFPIL